MNLLSKTLKVSKYYGPEYLLFRTRYALRKKSGLLQKQFPTPSWNQLNKNPACRKEIFAEDFDKEFRKNSGRFFFDPGKTPALKDLENERVLKSGKKILNNNFQYFFDDCHHLGDEKINWFLNPSTGREIEKNKHWTKIKFFGSSGDIKWIWEPSRFAWAYTLARAYAVSKDSSYPKKFWELFYSWHNANPPNIGPNYACGQECAIRLFAMCFACFAFFEVSQPEQIKDLLTVVAFHADRIEKNIEFAISTRTNHSISEAAGIYTAGILFPYLHSAQKWRKKGREIFVQETQKQIYPDGSYIQHSMNYHRLALQVIFWSLLLGDLNGEKWPDKFLSQIKKSYQFLYQMQDPVSGRVPNYGANDGALVIPLNSCDYLDYRPVLNSAHYYFNREPLYECGLWDEDLYWLFGKKLHQRSYQPEYSSSEFSQGGYHTIRDKDSWAMFRCHTFKDRPSHADLLTIDLWWKGQNILRDSGTFMYNCSEPWQSFFPSTQAHNTITVDGQNQIGKISRFMWIDWPHASFFCNCSTQQVNIRSGMVCWDQQIPSVKYHLRTVVSLNKENIWAVIDDVSGAEIHEVKLNWQLCPFSWKQNNDCLWAQTANGPVQIVVLSTDTKGSPEIHAGRENPPAGWQSLYYGKKQDAPVSISTWKSLLPLRIVTIISLGKQLSKWSFDNNAVCFTMRERSWKINLLPMDNNTKNILKDINFPDNSYKSF